MFTFCVLITEREHNYFNGSNIPIAGGGRILSLVISMKFDCHKKDDLLMQKYLTCSMPLLTIQPILLFLQVLYLFCVLLRNTILQIYDIRSNAVKAIFVSHMRFCILSNI